MSLQLPNSNEVTAAIKLYSIFFVKQTAANSRQAADR